MSQNVTASLRTLLTEIVDYAGLFPPSELTMATAVQNYSNYLKAEHAWMLGRFVCPVARLEEFGEYAGKLLNSKQTWRLSALAGEYLAADLLDRSGRMMPCRIGHQAARGISTTRGSHKNCRR